MPLEKEIVSKRQLRRKIERKLKAVFAIFQKMIFLLSPRN